MSNENICGICWNDVGEDKVKTPCLHIYCTKCFFLWMKENSNCPMCRASFGSNEIRARREQLRNLDNSILDQHFAYQTIRNKNERLQRKNERLQRRNERLEYKNARLYDRKRTLVSHITTRYIIDKSEFGTPYNPRSFRWYYELSSRMEPIMVQRFR